MGSLKLTTLLTALIAVFALAVGCSGDDGEEPAAAEQQQAEAPTPDALSVQ